MEFLDAETLVYKTGAGVHLRKLTQDDELAPFVWGSSEVGRRKHDHSVP